MNCNKIQKLSVISLMALLLLATAVAWSQVEDDNGVALLMKSWRWESEDGQSTIDFSTNTLMLLDGKPVEYTLSRERIMFPGGGEPVLYRYEGLTDRLTLTFPNGVTTEYGRALSSVMSRRHDGAAIDNGGQLHGKFCERSHPAEGDLLVRAIIFYDDATFDVSPRPTHAGVPVEEGDVVGTALLWGNKIILSYDDGVAAEADVVSRDESGAVATFRYLKSLYVRGGCPEQAEPDVILLPPVVPQSGQVAPSSPPPEPSSVTPAAPGVDESGKNMKQGPRDFGKTRGKQESGAKSSRKSGRKRGDN